MNRLLLTFLFFPFNFALAQPGVLDYYFGNAGIALGSYSTQYSYAYAVAQQADGKIVVTGYLQDTTLSTFVTRFDTNGVVDATFSNPILVIGQLGDYGRAITVQPDGKIIIAGFADNLSTDIYVARLLPSGDLDSTFGTGGITITDFGNNTLDHAHDIALQADGKIIVTGWVLDQDINIALLRYNNDGTLDSTFGVNGKVSTDIDSMTQQAYSVAIQPDGKILVAGYTSTAVNGDNVVVIRYRTDGTIDPDFGVNGISNPAINQDDDGAYDMALQADGKIVLAGFNYTVIPFADNLLVRLDTTGALDHSFGQGGVVAMNFTNNDNYATSVLIQPDGKIITTGRAISATSDFLLARFKSDGQLDSTFGTLGFKLTSVASDEDYIYSSLLQPDQKIVVAGYYSNNLIENFAVARYNSDSTFNVSVSENNKIDIGIYPQPAGDELFVKYNSDSRNKPEVNIYNVVGEKFSCEVNKEVISQKQSMLKISSTELAPGIYVVEVDDAGRNFHFKFLKD
jgi:uncharacterized delta-60 repeat protein